MKHIRALRYIITVMLLVFLLSPTLVSAFDGDGDGTGEGLGLNKDITLTLESSSVTDGQSDIAVNETFQLNFNKNICNVLVLSNNKTCFHLTDTSGAAIPIYLVFPDDQVQQDYKRQAFITPVQDLESNTEYRISVDSTLMAKNGTYIDNAHTITFTTGSEHTDAENQVLKELGDYIVTYETAYSETADSVPVKQTGLEDIAMDSGTDLGFLTKAAAIMLIQLILIFTISVILIKGKNK